MKPLIDPTTLPRPLKRLLKAPRALTARLRTLPDFLIIGAQRCGTTSLYRYLIGHPCVAPAFRKEVHFFEKNFVKGVDWYREHFPSLFFRQYVRTVRRQEFVTGEASVYYIFHPLASRRVFETIPGVKLIALLRNPVDRAYSHYQHEVRKGRETLSFEEAIEREPERLTGERERMLADERYDSFNVRYHSYLTRGLYADQLENWLTLFPRDRLLVIRSEDFFADPAAVLAQTLGFLGLSRWEPRTFPKYNYAGHPRLTAATYGYASYRKMDPATRRRLVDYFQPHNERLYELLCRDFGWDQSES